VLPRQAMTRRPQAQANILPVIAAETSYLSDIRVRFFSRFIQRSTESNHIGQSMAGGYQAAIAVVRYFVPPQNAIDGLVQFHRKMRSFHLHVGTNLTGQSDGAAELAIRIEGELQFFVSGTPQENVHRIGQDPQEHGSRGNTDADIVFNDVPLVVPLNGGDLNW